MSLSDKVQEHITNAQAELRSAIFHSSRNEKPATIQGLSNILCDLDKLSTVADILEHLENLKGTHKTKWTDYND